MLTTFDVDEYAFAALRSGASGFLLKNARPHELVEAIRTVAAGSSVVAPRAAPHARPLRAAPARGRAAGGRRRPRPRLRSLTPRELDVLRCVAEGMSNAEIADRLVLSATTVKTHVGNLLAKLGVRDRVQAVIVAYESGLVGSRG